jgi:hypothetical protein
MLSYLFSYLPSSNSLPENTKDKKVKHDDDFVKLGGYIISEQDLKSVTLHPRPFKLSQPMLKPYNKVDIRNLNREQLDSIMNVKLRPIPPKVIKLQSYEIRHPCLRELLRTRQMIH